MIVKFIKGLFNRDIELETKGITSSFAEFIRPQLDDQSSDKLTEYYKSWIYSCVNMNAKVCADQSFKLLSDVKPRVSQFKSLVNNDFNEMYDILDHPVKYMFEHPNENDTFYSFMFKIVTYLELDGNSYVYIVKDSSGIPQKMYVLQSQYVTVQSLGGVVQKYHYGASLNGKYQYSFNPDEILHIKYFDPNDDIYGISPLEACVASQKLIDSMNTMESALNRNLGVPAGILKYNTKVNAKERETIEATWQRKFSSVGRAGKLLVTDNDVNYETIAINPRDMQFITGRRWSREEIFTCYGVPTSILLNENVNRSNLDTSYEIYLKFTIQPKLKLISQSFTNFIHQNGINGKNLYLDFTTPVREKTQEEKLAHVKFMLENELITKEEAKDLLK